ncbi:ArnT family glycosyltransferase [Falsiroseomonas oryzae]|uniref:ArnT family glycosyltransferase n=1 Tax=Falsiroseomonas oryzae TaxID=2766473 RepID=UPI0022EA91D9|nr:hypothetical protein [Roseomonas sp. MO-31]
MTLIERDAGARRGAAGWIILVAAVPLLALAALANPDRFNPDAVGYLALARHWYRGDWGLAISGYWGPLFPWLAALLLPMTGDALAAGRAVMAVSGLLFLAGGMALLRALALPAEARVAGAVCLLGFALAWSVHIMTPDLLLAALLMSGVAVALGGRSGLGLSRAVLGGALFGLAYYAKGVALPLGLGFAVMCGAWHLTGGVPWRVALARVVLGVAAMLAVAAPWITVLSVHYGKPTMGTTGTINLAIAGPAYTPVPGQVFLGHPAFATFHAPPPGRVTAWEEPDPAAYVTWSPVADAASARHALQLVRSNLDGTIGGLRGFDAIGLGLAALVLGMLAVGTGLRPWQAAIAPVGMVAGIYLPVVSAPETRYLVPAYAFLVAAAAGLACTLAAAGGGRWAKLRRAAAALLVAGAFLFPLRHDIAIALLGRPNPALVAAREVAARVQEAGVPGGIASVEELGFAAIFAAFLLDRPFQGTEAALPPPGRFAELGTGVVLVRPGGAADQALAQQPGALRMPLRSTAVAAWRLR